MRIHFSILLLAASLASAAQTAAAQAAAPLPAGQVLLVGTRHAGNARMSHQQLLRYLQSWQPDIVLWESDKDFRRVFGLRTASFLGVAHVSIEQTALQRYSRRQPQCLILGYDTSFDRKRFVSEMIHINTRLTDSLNAAYAAGRMDSAERALFASYDALDHYFSERFLELDLASMNSRRHMDSLLMYMQAERLANTQLGRRHTADSALVQDHQEQEDFWQARNAHMARRIQQVRQAHPGKSIVVLMGAAHKPELMQLLGL
ncbi:MAG: hypothetical protein MUF62_11710, partial [Chitinophagaceae bacterium]|nr:hypothetical protein [Chitinophagaceae bacterium]